MHLTKAGILAILAFSTATLANIFPDEDPCNPVPALEGEYQGEFDLRMDLSEARCNCEFPEPAPSEQPEEYDERNRIDSQRCGPSGAFPIEPYFDPGPLPDLGPIVVPIPVGGWGGAPNWRDRRGWRSPRWRSGGLGRRPGRHFDRKAPRPRGTRGGGFWGHKGRPEGRPEGRPGGIRGGGARPPPPRHDSPRGPIGHPEPVRGPVHAPPPAHRDPPRNQGPVRGGHGGHY